MYDLGTLLVLRYPISVARITSIEKGTKELLPAGTLVKVIGINDSGTWLIITPINAEFVSRLERYGRTCFGVKADEVTIASEAAKILYN